MADRKERLRSLCGSKLSVIQMGGKGACPKASKLSYFELKLFVNKNTQEIGHKEILGDRIEVVICQMLIQYQIVCKLFQKQNFKVV